MLFYFFWRWVSPLTRHIKWKNYYARIAKFDNLSQHYNVKKDGKILNFTRKGNDTNLMKAATVVIVNENDKEYHVNYNEAIYVVPKKDVREWISLYISKNTLQKQSIFLMSVLFYMKLNDL